MITAVALPAALFGMGGVLYQYRPQGDIGPIIMICAVSLIIHPAIVWFSGLNFDLSETQLRSTVITAAMAPGINTYVFANIYGRANALPQQAFWSLQRSQLAQFGYGSACYPKTISLLSPKNRQAVDKLDRNPFVSAPQ